MTVEELKKIANEMGYNIIKKQEYVKLLPCKCGHNRREHWYGVNEDNAFIFVCEKCGAKAQGRTNREAKLNWNRMMSEDDIEAQRDYEAAVEQMEHDILYEPTYSQEDGSI